MARLGRADEWREWMRDAVRHPVSTIASLISLAAMMLIVAVPSLLRFWRERRRYRKLGRKLGIYRGKVLRWTYQPGGLSAGEPGPELRVTTLRRGNWEDALKDLSDRARSVGYRTPNINDAPSPASRRRHFAPPPQRGLPNLTVALYVPGEVIEDLDAEVPIDRTGLQFRLREYRRRTGFG